MNTTYFGAGQAATTILSVVHPYLSDVVLSRRWGRPDRRQHVLRLNGKICVCHCALAVFKLIRLSSAPAEHYRTFGNKETLVALTLTTP